MAALAMCEAAAMTGDASAVRSAEAAVRYTLAMQHPTTGGWRYMKGEAGDLSQLGWQVMVLDAGQRAGIRIPPYAFQSAAKFMGTVSGQSRRFGLLPHRRSAQSYHDRRSASHAVAAE